MAMPAVALLPSADGTAIPHVVLPTQPFIVSDPPPGVRWPAHVAAQLAGTGEPLILVFFGQAAVHAPALGFSRRSLRRPAIGYVLVDPVMPMIGGEYGDWPDAPVTVVLSADPPEHARDAALQARLRAWTVTSASLQDVVHRLSA